MTTIGVLISAHPPRFNSGLLSRCLNSVMSQHRVPDQIAVAVDHEGRGAAWCKNEALGMLTTDYVAVIDSDDEMLPHHLEIHERAIHEHGADMAYSWFHTDPPGGDPFPEFFFSAPFDPEHPRHTTTVIVARRDMMLKVGYSAAEFGVYEDDDWRMTLGLIALGAKIHHIPDRSWIWHHGHNRTAGRSWR